jgi:DNA-binding LacI/PurR family transcriptional regulator
MSSTLSDVAREAGVSKGTASKALNGQPGVSAATRARVVSAAEDLGWKPSYAARALSRSATGVFGLGIARSSETVGAENFFMAFVAGMEEELSHSDRALLMQIVPDVRAEAALLERWAAERRVDGVVLMDARVDDPRIPVIAAAGVPAAAMACEDLGAGIAMLLVDEEERMRTMLEHLASRSGGGHERIAYIAGPPEFLHVARRRRAFEEICAARGIGGSVLTSDYRRASIARWAREILALHEEEGCRAVVVDNELLAAQLLAQLRGADLAVPRDLAVTALEDSILCTVTDPPLTALGRDVVENGRQLARLLVGLAEQGPAGTVIADPGAVVERGSS